MQATTGRYAHIYTILKPNRIGDKRFSGTVKLPRVPRPGMSVCVLGDQHDVCSPALPADAHILIPHRSTEQSTMVSMPCQQTI